jgi:hypothetical protein
MLCYLVKFAGCLLDARILLDFFSLYSVDQPSFIFSSGAYLFRVASDVYFCNLWVFLGSLALKSEISSDFMFRKSLYSLTL